MRQKSLNPASESFSVEIEIGDGQNAQLQLYNITGQLMLKQQLVPQQQIYAVGSTGLQAGVYILRVVIDGVATESKRLIIVK